jgi:hypothetical protein
MKSLATPACWKRAFWAVVLALFFAVLLSDGVSACDVPPAGKVVNVRGGVQVIGMTTTTAVPCLLLRNGDTIVTGADGWVAVVLADETLLQLNRNSRFTIKEVAANAGWNRIRNVIVKTVDNYLFSTESKSPLEVYG